MASAPHPVELEPLALAVLKGEPNAFTRLALAVWPFAYAAARRTRRDAEVEDERQELYARLLARLESNDYSGLRTFVEWRVRHPEKSFTDWLRIVVANLSRDRTRERVGRQTPTNSLPSAKRLLNELSHLTPVDDVSYRPPITSAQTAREILEFANLHLPKLQALALSTWITGESFDELRERTGVSTEEEATRLVRAALATLRRHFAIGE
jgi:DNA-directed RNA polymerase specialized sigma24 family protein